MAFASSTLVNGEWTTRTLDVDTVLRHYNQKDKDFIDTSPFQHEIVPKLGVLTQTVIPSSLVHWILAARLRDLETQDVVFIGDDFVQVKELRADGSLHDVVRKDNFGSRIRNARIVGSIKEFENDLEAQIDSAQFKDEEDDFYMDPDVVSLKNSRPIRRILPPQVIVLQLSSGDLVFLRLSQSDNGSLEFISDHRKVSKTMLKLQPGMHLAADPSSRYIALGCSEGVVAIYALHSRKELKASYSVTSNLQYVASNFHLFLTGAILKVEFLHPAPDDDEHIILIVLVAAKGKTRMLVFEWETGSKLSDIRPHSTKGHLLDKDRQLPLLLIPLTIKSSFVLVCENSMSVCLGILHGAPTFIDFNDRVDPPTEFHNGLGTPLWTSWTRALRFPSRAATIDDIFVVREDGLLKLLELDSTLDEIVKSDNNIGEFGVSCGTALACLYVQLGDFTKSGDMFVIGGDACTGGTYLLPARRNPALLEPIPNWSPAHDLVTTQLSQNLDVSPEWNNHNRNGNQIPKPDRVFACVGKGLNGAIVEFRQGLEAKIGLEMDVETPIMQSWVFNDFITGPDDGREASLFLLSLGDRSKLLRMTNHPAEIEELDETQTQFDLRYRTIAASVTQQNHFIQVTEKSITMSSGSGLRRLEGAELLTVPQVLPNNTGPTIYSAFVDKNFVLFTTKSNSSVVLQVLQNEDTEGAMELDEASETPSNSDVRTLAQYSSHISCLTTCTVNGVKCVVVAQRVGDTITLDLQPLRGGNTLTFTLPTSGVLTNGLELESIASISIKPSQSGTLRLLCGTHNGILVAIELDVPAKEIVASHANRIGATTVTILEDQHSIYGFFAICDSKLYSLQPKLSLPRRRTTRNWARSFEICRLWLTDALRLDMVQPRLTSIASQPPSQLITSTRDLLMTAGSQIIVAALSPEVKAVPRHIRIGGTPTRFVYSPSLEALIVAASVKGKSTLLFIDLDTGADLSQPIDQKTKEPVEFISGLGNSDERIFRIFEWAYTKDGKTWNFIILGTSTGRLMIVSVDNQERIRKDIQNALFQTNGKNGSERPKISYYTRYKFKGHAPVYSVVGYSEGLIWCAGETLFCDALDLTAKKFKRVTEYILPSPAINLWYDNGIITALTLNHSLEILKVSLNEVGETQIVRTHGDQVTRPSLHHIICSQSSPRPIHLVSDKNSSLIGLWPTENTKADTLDTVFEAPLPSSILRFRFARCRPCWDSVWTAKQGNRRNGKALQLENIPDLVPHSEILGLSITGVLSHYTILNHHTWKFLRFFMDLAIRSAKACEFTFRNDAAPLQALSFPKTMMHVDGDILKRCLREGLLENLLGVVEDRIECPGIFARFCELLQDLHQGSLAGDRSPVFYIDQAYMDLEFFLRPVLQ